MALIHRCACGQETETRLPIGGSFHCEGCGAFNTVLHSNTSERLQLEPGTSTPKRRWAILGAASWQRLIQPFSRSVAFLPLSLAIGLAALPISLTVSYSLRRQAIDPYDPNAGCALLALLGVLLLALLALPILVRALARHLDKGAQAAPELPPLRRSYPEGLLVVLAGALLTGMLVLLGLMLYRAGAGPLDRGGEAGTGTLLGVLIHTIISAALLGIPGVALGRVMVLGEGIGVAVWRGLRCLQPRLEHLVLTLLVLLAAITRPLLLLPFEGQSRALQLLVSVLWWIVVGHVLVVAAITLLRVGLEPVDSAG